MDKSLSITFVSDVPDEVVGMAFSLIFLCPEAVEIVYKSVFSDSSRVANH